MTERLPDELAAALVATVAERGVFGARVHYASEVGSTNDLAAAAADRGEPEGTTFVAAAQTAGRGRLGRTWFSPPDAGLYLSTIVRRASAGPVDYAGGRRRGGGRHSRRDRACRVQIKWPNDIVAVGGAGFRARRKIAGILAEASSGPEGVTHVVLGVGINLRPAAFPPELADRVSAIETELGRHGGSGAVLAQVLGGAEPHAGRPGQRRAASARDALARVLAVGSRRADRMGWRRARDQDGRPAGLAEDGALLARTRTASSASCG